MRWNGTNIKTGWLRKQGRGAKSYRRCRPLDWYCDGCQHTHHPTTDRVITLDGRTLCFRMFAKEPCTQP